MDIKQILGSNSPSWEFGERVDVELPDYFSESVDVFEVAKKSEVLDTNNLFWNQRIQDTDVTKNMYKSSFSLHVKEDVLVDQSFIGIIANTIDFHGNTLSVTPTGEHFSGRVNTNVVPSMLPQFPKSLKGGGSWAYGSTATEMAGQSWLSGGSYSPYPNYKYARGGGAMIIFADEIKNGILEAKGEIQSGASGGGGMILIYVKSWDATVSINVKGGTNAEDGTYAIFKINNNGTATLMVCSENGLSVELDGETPVYGADASIIW